MLYCTAPHPKNNPRAKPNVLHAVFGGTLAYQTAAAPPFTSNFFSPDDHPACSSGAAVAAPHTMSLHVERAVWAPRRVRGSVIRTVEVYVEVGALIPLLSMR